MAFPSFKVGDRVRIVRAPLSVGQEIPEETVELFRRCVGHIFRVDGFDENGHLELNVADEGSQAPDDALHTIWIEPEFVEIAA